MLRVILHHATFGLPQRPKIAHLPETTLMVLQNVHGLARFAQQFQISLTEQWHHVSFTLRRLRNPGMHFDLLYPLS